MRAQAVKVVAVSSLPEDRRERLLVSAETCFGRSGFDRTTMQDIAREAAMSPANIYRYFESKEALIVGLVDRDRERAIALLDRLRDAGTDELTQLLSLIEQFMRGLSRDAAILRLTIWAESARNPAIADLVGKGERENRDWVVSILKRLAPAPDSDVSALYAVFIVTLRGMIVSRAIQATSDPAPMVAHLKAVLVAGLEGLRPAEAGSPA